MKTNTTAQRISVGETIDTTTGARQVVRVSRDIEGMRKLVLVLTVKDPASPTGETEIRFAPDAKVYRLGLTAATMAARRTR